MPKKINISRSDMEKIKTSAGLGETMLNYRSEIINANNYVTLDKYDNKVVSEEDALNKKFPIWDDVLSTYAVVWVDGEIITYPSESNINIKADSKTKNYFINHKKRKANDIIIIKADSYGNLITKEQQAYEELLFNIKHLSLNKIQYCEIISLASFKLKNIVTGEMIKDKFSSTVEDVLSVTSEDIKKVSDYPGVKKMLEDTNEEYKKEYAEVASK